MRVISYLSQFKAVSINGYVNDYKQAIDHGENIPKTYKFKSGAELTDYLQQIFTKDQYMLNWCSNSPSTLLLAIDNELVTVHLFQLKHMDKYILDTLLFNNGLIKQRFFVDDTSTVTVKGITEPIHFGG